MDSSVISKEKYDSKLAELKSMLDDLIVKNNLIMTMSEEATAFNEVYDVTHKNALYMIAHDIAIISKQMDGIIARFGKHTVLYKHTVIR